MKYKTSDLVKVYKGTPTFEDGQICTILDRDPHDNSYAVAPLEVTAAVDYQVEDLLRNHAKWVKESDIEKIEFAKPKHKYLHILVPAFLFFLGMNLGQLLNGL